MELDDDDGDDELFKINLLHLKFENISTFLEALIFLIMVCVSNVNAKCAKSISLPW